MTSHRLTLKNYTMKVVEGQNNRIIKTKEYGLQDTASVGDNY